MVGVRKFFLRPFWNLHYDVINSRLETGRRLLGNVVGDLIQTIADGEAGRDLRNRESGRFGSQRRAARDAWIHFDHNHAPSAGVDGKLNVGAAGLHTHGADHLKGGVTHELVLFVRECLLRRDSNRIAGVNSHGIEILDRANDHRVVGMVTHDLKLKFLPAEHRFFHQHFVHRAELQSPADLFFKFLPVVSNARPRPAQRERRPYDERIAEPIRSVERLSHIVRERAARNLKPHPEHQVFE